MKIKVDSEYLDEVDWISFEKIRNWSFSLIPGFAYDNVRDSEIEEAINLQMFENIDISKDWQDCRNLSYYNGNSSSSYNFHILRIAKLVSIIVAGTAIRPITIDTFCRYSCPSCVSDGNHRLRAMEFIGNFDVFPAFCNGNIEVLSEINGT